MGARKPKADDSTVSMGSTVPGEEGVGSPSGERASSVRPELPTRYEDLGGLATGGFGEVRRVRDTVLGRVLAMKILHRDVSAIPALRRRFFTEVQITAQLQHPGIVPLYDHGELRDGRLWYAMKEVRGTTLGTIIDELHAASSWSGFGTPASGWTFRRVIDAFARIVQTVAYAHREGVVHRDLKPENLMVGELGEVMVMDWGLARRVAPRRSAGEIGEEASLSHEPLSIPPSADLTRHGDVLGTPAYMPPEQARGARDLHGPPSDVYSLGAILYTVLAGRPPYRGSGLEVIQQILAVEPPPVAEMARGGPPIPDELVCACEQAMRREPADRCTAVELAEDVVAWLDGARRREHALDVLATARALEPAIAESRARAEAMSAEAGAQLAKLRSFDDIDAKRPAWQLQDEAARLGRESVLAETKWLQIVHGALTIDADLGEAHAMLADHYRAALVHAERAHQDDDATRFEVLLRAHDRGAHTAFLQGEGALTLVTDPPGARVTLVRYDLSDRSLVEVPERDLGETPLLKVPVQRGSYLLRLRAPGRAEVRYPILVERGGHWDGVPPGESEPLAIALPKEGELGVDDCYVPAGWCWIGGDPDAPDGLPARRIWIDAFVIRRYPVTNFEYVEFLNDLVASGREAEALAACPRKEDDAVEGTADVPMIGRDEQGRFVLPRAADDPAWQPRAPIAYIDWHSACRFAAWMSGVTGVPFRLPNELEREKAARGVDGRKFPWGDHAEPTFACGLDSHRGKPRRESVGGHPVDESCYGVRGLTGNVRDWCVNPWRHDGPPVESGCLRLDAALPEDPEFRAIRGGYWGSPVKMNRPAGRYGGQPQFCRFSVGLRLARR